MERSTYHHGQLPETLLAAAAKLIVEVGPSALSLREVARRAGVSHGAPAHHFGDKAGLLTALAAQGFVRFREALEAARDAAGSDALQRFGATGYAYVMFADRERAHFEVMFRPDLWRKDDPTLMAAMTSAYATLGGVIADAQRAGHFPGQDAETLAVIAWSQAHGMATLWLTGNLQLHEGMPDIASLARKVFGGMPGT